jgi:hypothetical protein
VLLPRRHRSSAYGPKEEKMRVRVNLRRAWSTKMQKLCDVAVGDKRIEVDTKRELAMMRSSLFWSRVFRS